MIPKTIHYIWLSGEEKPDLVKKNIEGWKKTCSGYEIKEWTSQDLDMNLNSFVRQAYGRNKWALASDFFRLWILYNYGGIYLDSDVEVLKPFDPFLEYKAFTGFEHNHGNAIEAAVIGAEAGLPIFEEMLKEYDVEKRILNKDGSANFRVIPVVMTDVLKKHGFKRTNLRQSVADIEIFPSDYFSCKHNVTLKVETTQNSVAIHHFTGTWFTKDQSILMSYRQKYGKIHIPLLMLTKPFVFFRLTLNKLKKKV